MSSSEHRDTIHLRLTSGGATGLGEGAAIVRYHETAVDGQKAIESIRPLLASANPWQYDKLMSEVSRRVDGQFVAKAAIDSRSWIGPALAMV